MVSALGVPSAEMRLMVGVTLLPRTREPDPINIGVGIEQASIDSISNFHSIGILTCPALSFVQ